jgi:RNA polymerase sigma factor (TIGR02999 family)
MGPDSSADITQLLHAWRAGDGSALERLTPLVYDDLRRIARRHLARERAGATLQPTALVHEAWLRLARHERVAWQDRAHFLAVGALTIRRLLVEQARRRRAQKRGGGALTVTLSAAAGEAAGTGVDLIALDQALDRLAELSPRQARVVELRYFGGLTVEETAGVLGVSPATVKVDWQMARAWLFAALKRGAPVG